MSRTYVESPVWRRQQQQQQQLSKSEDEQLKLSRKDDDEVQRKITDNDSGLNVSTSDLQNDDGNEKRLSIIKRRSTISLRNDGIFIISDNGIEYEQQKSSLYAIVKRNREKDEDSI